MIKKPMSVVVASFDVGIKNLAFCVLSYDGDAASGLQFPIREWRCVDVTDDSGAGEKTCVARTQKGATCGKAAKILTDQGEPYCGMHNPDKTRYEAKKSSKVKNLGYERLGNAFLDELEKHIDIWNQVDHVIIEQQFKKNRRMIFLSAIIFGYFMNLKRNDACRISHVKFASSRNKLQVYSDCGGPAITERTRKGDKDHRKWLAPKHCEWLIRGSERCLDSFRRYPRKKDDLADAFLQGADYLYNECRAVKRVRKRATKRATKRV